MLVCVEATAKRAFASALDWPGWCRSGRDERAALDALADHEQRYSVVACAASEQFVTGDLEVIERMVGNATTTFGAPAIPATAEGEPSTTAAVQRLAALVAGAWTVFDQVVAATPQALRKGPRGGGRDRDPMVAHVLAAEHAYAAKIGVHVPAARGNDPRGIAVQREAILDALLRAGADPVLTDRGWPPRYAARRVAWHVLDHAWEMEDRTGS
ncbi:MAG: hypothetical protein ACRENL_09325 [Candidatus Dormibacteria bacterium]